MSNKNIVICCDGTGNEISENISNVLKLYRVMSKDNPDQVVFYDPGVGTLARPDLLSKFMQDTKMVLSMATGYGLDDNVLKAYEFLIDNYNNYDDIYLFGFSRGAHTVRVLAGLIHMVGLLRPEQKNLAGSALTAYKQTSNIIDQQTTELVAAQTGAPINKSKINRAEQFSRIVSSRWPTIKFVGVWDTVASVFVPRPDRFYMPSLQTLPYTRRNPSVAAFRHAMSIDERRRLFRLSPWDEQQNYLKNRWQKDDVVAQDVKQVWFAGVHSDVGGGYPEIESGLSKFPLLWMIDEAKAHGLKVNTANINQLVWGNKRKGSPFDYVPPDPASKIHDSMNIGWRILEMIPKSDRYKEWPQRESVMGFYIPNAEPRPIAENVYIHESVFENIALAKTDRHPDNLPKTYQVVPIQKAPNGVQSSE
jgi:uncharacterized protein (DUF2235 family)